MNGYLLSADLMFTSSVKAAAEQAGLPLQVVGSTAKLLEKLGEEPRPMVVIDLAVPKLQVSEYIGQLKALATPPDVLLAYGAHVYPEALAAAQQAGCTQVFTRGQFNASMDEIFQHFASA
ncbi:hypothetical protein [Lignipirellula cremea]|uniref:Response regulatory domain-containing protein n=1 Tax=Lignipirellula cremea TaxID=2528010 RepID=A0A518DR29_9BACT|nr:hypothetical protein [Lignipirellula cremea]QDU94300.1 hypothetical protein Pla8534_20890 [Lignipirellula cremea]